MEIIRHVLCPVDLSEPARHALRYAAALCSVVDAELTILHVRTAHSNRAGAKNPSHTSLETFARGVVGLERSIRLIEREGEPVAEILAAAAAVAPGVIVMGAHGRTGLQRLRLGSVSERVIRRSQTPVLVVPPGFREEGHGSIEPTNVLCAVDPSEPSSRAVEFAASIAAATHARLVLVHVLEWSEEVDTLPNTSMVLPSSEHDAIARMNELVSDEVRVRCAPELVVGYGSPADEVLRIAAERQVNLIVLGIRRRSPLDLAVFGSTAQQLIRHGTCALLTVHST